MHSSKKKNGHLLAKFNLYTPNQIKSCVRKLYFSTLLCYTSKPQYESNFKKFEEAEIALRINCKVKQIKTVN